MWRNVGCPIINTMILLLMSIWIGLKLEPLEHRFATVTPVVFIIIIGSIVSTNLSIAFSYQVPT